VIRNITYGPDSITYTKFDAVSTERLKLGGWTPKSVTGGTMQWDAKAKVLTVQAKDQAVRITP
jgi:hypothetical protein